MMIKQPDKAISMEWRKVMEAGSCNVCQRRDDPDVIEISLRSIGVRLCLDCARLVLTQLSQFNFKP